MCIGPDHLSVCTRALNNKYWIRGEYLPKQSVSVAMIPHSDYLCNSRSARSVSRVPPFMFWFLFFFPLPHTTSLLPFYLPASSENIDFFFFFFYTTDSADTSGLVCRNDVDLTNLLRLGESMRRNANHFYCLGHRVDNRLFWKTLKRQRKVAMLGSRP